MPDTWISLGAAVDRIIAETVRSRRMQGDTQ
jgi:hypothetical protein